MRGHWHLSPSFVHSLRLALASAALTPHLLRRFAQIWGITIGGAILQNQLLHRLPAAFTQQFPGGVQIAYAAIPFIAKLEPALKDEVRRAFADSLRVLWFVLLGVSLFGAAAALLVREVPMHTYTDENLGLEVASTEEVNVDVGLSSQSHCCVVVENVLLAIHGCSWHD